MQIISQARCIHRDSLSRQWHTQPLQTIAFLAAILYTCIIPLDVLHHPAGRRRSIAQGKGLSCGWELVPTAEGSEIELKFRGLGLSVCTLNTNEIDWDFPPQILAVDTGMGPPDETACRALSVYVSEAKNKPPACTYCYEGECCKFCSSLES